MSSKTFNIGEYVVYPSHGVGKITSLETQKVANLEMPMYKIAFEKDKMNLCVPASRATKIGLRSLCSKDDVEKAVAKLTERAQTTRGIMWSRRAQEYEKKINSGDLLAISEVIRDLYRNIRNPERSYSERVIFDSAYERFITEICLVRKIDRAVFEEEFNNMLKADDVIAEDTDFDDDDDETIAA